MVIPIYIDGALEEVALESGPVGCGGLIYSSDYAQRGFVPCAKRGGGNEIGRKRLGSEANTTPLPREAVANLDLNILA